ncbi:GNAT family N-acetyltransferase [Rhodospira trueperi]|uniref:GNAT family N-acetyltransferase n=1 Tax=Rhodospira trueperi TaxID=69960 RepID=UPI000B86A410|nr:GNAT family protein [Rhodospira trueperi]
MNGSSFSASVRLRPVKLEDSDLLFEWINNRDLVVMNAPFRPISETEHKKWFEGISLRKDVSFFMIEDSDSGLAIGSCQLTNIHDIHRSAELQIRIGRFDFQNKGAGSAAVRLLVDHGFHTLKLHRIMLHVFSTNLRAIHVYQKAGFKQEGLLREAAFIEGRWLDVLIFGLLRTERS